MAERIEQALKAARETRRLEVASGALASIPTIFQQQFGATGTPAIVADTHTFEAAGRAVQAGFAGARQQGVAPFLFNDPDLYAEHRFVERLDAWMQSHAAIPVAVGSGTIND